MEVGNGAVREVRATTPGRPARWTRDVVDRVVAASALIILSPLAIAISIWILVTAGRPVFFVQERAGRDGVPFRMWKFRTMVNDAIAAGQRLGLTEDPFGLIEDDPRITRSGGFLRRTSLDELPQLLNVVLGHMSLVGPRPDVLPQVANYTDADRERLAVKPGITGWAQVNGRESLTWPQRFELDRWYVAHRSLGLDCRIIWMTVASLHREDVPVYADEFNIKRLRDADLRGVDGG
jgi:sugar transferase EpsL